MQCSKRIVFVEREVDWTKSRAGLKVNNERKERDKKSEKKDGIADTENQLGRKVLHKEEEVQCRRESKQWVESCANAPNLLLMSLFVLSKLVSLTLYHGDIHTMFFSENEPHRLLWVRLLTQHS